MTTETDEKGMVKYATDHGEVKLTIQSIKRMFAPKATDQEAAMFLTLCHYQRLNPFLREAYLIKYNEGQPATIVVGKDTFTKRAQQQPDFQGFRAGVVVKRGDAVVEVEGALPLPGDALIGGWAEVSRKDMNPFRCSVAMEEYHTQQSSWKKMPATMIRKVALVQALREAYPSAFQGLYDASEMGGMELPEVKVEAPKEEEGISTPPPDPMCSKHNAVFERKERGNQVWYSHKAPDGKWCNMPSETQPEPQTEAPHGEVVDGEPEPMPVADVIPKADGRDWRLDKVTSMGGLFNLVAEFAQVKDGKAEFLTATNTTDPQLISDYQEAWLTYLAQRGYEGPGESPNGS